MLDIMGYGFDYEFDVDNNEPIDIDATYRFVSERGFKRSKNATFLGKDIINLKKRNLKDVPLSELKEITKKAITFCLDGNDLASRKIFRTLKR